MNPENNPALKKQARQPKQARPTNTAPKNRPSDQQTTQSVSVVQQVPTRPNNRRRAFFKRPAKTVPKKPNFAFIDSQNLNLGIQKMGWKLDWRKFREYLRAVHNVENAYLFIGYLPENEQLYMQMHDLGYLIVLKPTLEAFADPTKDKAPSAVSPEVEPADAATTPPERKNPVKGNIDAELVLYAMKEMPQYDKAVIVSGDGDFYCLVEYLSEQNKLQAVLAPNRFHSTLLKPFEQFITRLDTMRTDLAYKDRSGPRGLVGHNMNKAKHR